MDERADLGRPVGIRGLPCRAGSGGACFGDLRRSGGEGMTRRSASPSRADRPASRNGEERSKSDLQADQRLGHDGGLSSAEAAARLERYGANTPQARQRGAGGGGCDSAVDVLGGDPGAPAAQWAGELLGGTSGRERDRRPQAAAGQT